MEVKEAARANTRGLGRGKAKERKKKEVKKRNKRT
jgi:hypothetical protein